MRAIERFVSIAFIAGLASLATAPILLVPVAAAKESGHASGKGGDHSAGESTTESCAGCGSETSAGGETAAHESGSKGQKGGKGRRGAPDAVHGSSHSGVVGHIFEQEEPKDEGQEAGSRH